MVTAEEIRKEFPNVARSNGGGTYCVLGACGLYVSMHAHEGWCVFESFPEPREALIPLRSLNERLDREKAYEFALRIAHYNDYYDSFDAAWAELDRALSWKPAV